MATMFDTAHNRLSYSELLQPDIGFHLEFAVGLTYSLDLEALLGVPVALGLLDETDSELMQSPFYLLEAIRKSSNDIAIFCNAGGISLPHKIQSVYSLLENSVFEVKLKNRKSFHPKLWFIKYSNDEGQSYIKLLVLSRNLTFDNSIDLCVAMQGYITKVKRNKNKPLADLLTFVGEYADNVKRKRIAELAEDLLHVKSFDLDHPFEDYEFYPLGINGYEKENTALFRQKYDIFVVSPFLSDDIVKELTDCPYRKVLITRKASVTPTAMNHFDSIYITKELLSDNESGVKQDIHAKLYFTVTENGNYLYIGSANASHNAFYNNVEFLLRLKYKPNCVGFKTFFSDFIPDDNSPYEKIENVPAKPESDKLQEEIDKAFKDAIYAIKYATVIGNDGIYEINIHSRSFISNKTIKIAPLQRLDLLNQLNTETLLHGLLLKELSEFYILDVDGQKIVIKIETKGIPAERDDAVYKSIIDTKSKFMSYISFMLSEDYSTGAFEETESLHLFQDYSIGDNSSQSLAAIYEKMLKALHQNPSRLKDIADVIKRLDQSIVSREFMDMYQQFELVLRRRKK
ncbi:MAG: phospholipase D family protein [Mobilitalea sp.]